MSNTDELQATIDSLAQRGRGILAADESTPTITKRFQALGIESNAQTRHAYRELLLTTPEIGKYLSGIILYEETLAQAAVDGTPLIEVARRQGIVPGIKVDKGLVALPNAPGDKITQGLDDLSERLAVYKTQGARFAKWRAVYPIAAANPTPLGIAANAEVLARYAAACQEQGIVPIVEPEVLIDGGHSIMQCEEVTEAVQNVVFHALKQHRVRLEYIVLKPSMVVPGKAHPNQASPAEVAERTVRVLRRTVPAAVPTINFLSGGQTPEEATANLNAMNAGHPNLPWLLSFSYARALQEPPMAIWKGRPENVAGAQQAFLHRARLNAAAQLGSYQAAMESAA
jgi:fructose-bisphosphate aldolase class I